MVICVCQTSKLCIMCVSQERKNAYPLLAVMRLPFPFTLCDQCTPLLYTGTLYRYSIPLLYTVILNRYSNRYSILLLCTVTLYRYAIPLLYTVTLHCYSIPFLCTIILNRYSILLLYRCMQPHNRGKRSWPAPPRHMSHQQRFFQDNRLGRSRKELGNELYKTTKAEKALRHM